MNFRYVIKLLFVFWLSKNSQHVIMKSETSFKIDFCLNTSIDVRVRFYMTVDEGVHFQL